jgi:RimJ/RimL family protein N-acetyltransferase
MDSKPPLQETVRTVDTVDREAVLETERLRLEPLSRAHAAELFPVLADPRLYRFIPRDPPPSLASLEDRFQRLETRASPRGDEDWLNWVVRAKQDEQCIGRVEVTLRHADRSAYLAYELGTASWGQGLATEACRRVLATLWSDYGVSMVVAEVDTRNAASIRLLERLGFARGALRTNADFFKGESSDELTFTLASDMT